MTIEFPDPSLPDFDAHQLEDGRKLFRGDVQFVKGAVSLETLPPADYIEIAFAGRSNVGKSSLINALLGRNGMARTSNTPGRTQELNYFTVGRDHDLPFFLVDLPGYGYAKIERRKVEGWTRLVKTYLSGRATLRRVLLMIDSRHGIKANDEEIMTMLDSTAVNYQIILTKADKLNRTEQEKTLAKVKEVAVKHAACHPRIHLTSSEKGWGLDLVRADITALLRES